MKAMASHGATRPGSAAWRSRQGVRAWGPAPAVLWLALPGVAALALGAVLPAVAPTTRVGLAAIGLLLVVAGGLVARRAAGVERDRPRTSHPSPPARRAGCVPVGGHRAGRDARGRVPGVRSGHDRERRAPDRRARPSLPAARRAAKDR